MLHTKPQGNGPAGSREDCWRGFSIYGHVGHLGHVTRTICINFWKLVVRSPPVKYFTDRSKAVLLLWIFYVFVPSCVYYVFVRVCLYVFCGHLLGKG